MNLQKCLAITLALQMSLGMAAAPAIGVATVRGAFRVNDAALHGNGTLFSGARVETASAPGDLALISGEKLTLGTNSTAQVFSDHLVLERGESRMASMSGRYGVQVNGLRIITDETGASGRVSMGADNKILVASTAGRLQVATAAGVPLAAVYAGRALEFDTKAVNSGAMQLTGRVSRTGSKLFVTDEATDLTVELRSGKTNLQTVEKAVGKRVEVAGLHIPNSVPIALQVQSVGAAQAANSAGATAGSATTKDDASDVDKDGKKSNKKKKAAGAAAGAGAGAGAAGAAAGAGAAAAGISTAAVVTGVVVTGAAVGAGVGITKAVTKNASN
jgi:hypothetical protein